MPSRKVRSNTALSKATWPEIVLRTDWACTGWGEVPPAPAPAPAPTSSVATAATAPSAVRPQRRPVPDPPVEPADSAENSMSSPYGFFGAQQQRRSDLACGDRPLGCAQLLDRGGRGEQAGKPGEKELEGDEAFTASPPSWCSLNS